MNDPKKSDTGISDTGIVARKPANNTAQAAAEPVERRPVTNGSPRSQSTGRTQSRATVCQAAERIRQGARRNPKGKLTAPTLPALRVGPVARKWRPQEARGEMYIVRYADDSVPRRHEEAR